MKNEKPEPGESIDWYDHGILELEEPKEVKNGRYEEEGKTEWYLNDQLHREDGPAIEWANGTKGWFINGQRHREDGPAFIWPDDTQEWHLQDKLHREDGPAIETSSGTKFWYKNNMRHREDGTAIEWIDGSKQWFINGVEYKEKEFYQWLEKKYRNEDLKTPLIQKPTQKRSKI